MSAGLGTLGRSGRGWWALIAVAALAAAVIAVSAALLLTGGASPSAPPDWNRVRVDPDAPYLPTLANRELAVGRNRLSFVVERRGGAPAEDLRVQADLYDLETDPDAPVATQFAAFLSYAAVDPLPAAHRHAAGASLSDNTGYIGSGVYVVPAFLPHPGIWGVELTIEPVDGEGPRDVVRFRFNVRETGGAPEVGELAPAVETRTLATEPDIRRLTSDPDPEPGLYQLSLADALARERPLIVIFSTPAFCHSRTCGPSLETVKNVWRDHADAVDAIHVEVFENPDQPDALREAPAFSAWDLPSEPWIFVIDAQRRITARYEGTVTERELRGELEALLAPRGQQ